MTPSESTVTRTTKRIRVVAPLVGLLVLTAGCGAAGRSARVEATKRAEATTTTVALPAAQVTAPAATGVPASTSPGIPAAVAPGPSPVDLEAFGTDLDKALADLDAALTSVDQAAGDATRNGD